MKNPLSVAKSAKFPNLLVNPSTFISNCTAMYKYENLSKRRDVVDMVESTNPKDRCLDVEKAL